MLSGPEKAAFLVLSLEEDRVAPLLSRLQDQELRKLHEAAQGLRRSRVAPEMLTALYAEFSRGLRGEIPILHGGGEYLVELLHRSIGSERATRLLAQPASAPGPMDDLTGDTKTLAEMLVGEHPQAIAAVLSQVPATAGATVLSALPEDTQELVLDRMAAISNISPTAIRATRETLAAELGEGFFQSEAAAGIGRAAALMNELLPEHSAALMARLEARDPERAAAIQRERFTFADLARLDRRGMQVLLREVDPAQLVISMKTANDEIAAAVYGAMSSRAAQTLKEDVDNLGPQRLAEVERAQREIVVAAMRLQAEGKLVLITGGQVV